VRVFFDTNVWLSATLFPGLCAELLARCVEERHEVLTTPLIRAEALAVLAEKFPQRVEATALFDANLSVAERTTDVPEPSDDNDARLVAAAAGAEADIFVTGDARIRGWQHVGKMRIVSPRQAWMLLFMPEQTPEQI